MPADSPWQADTSAAIVLGWLQAGGQPGTYAFVTNNHFDIDGFLAVWCLQNPQLALQHAETIKLAALIGDFRESDPAHPSFKLALQLVCWVNAEEQQHFYEPFGRVREEQSCIPKYNYFLPKMAAFLSKPVAWQAYYGAELEQVSQDLHRWQSTETSITDVPALRLRIIETPKPLHYYALFAQTGQVDMVLSMYAGQRYELEYKYSTWVDTARAVYPRMDLKPLAERLQAIEQAPYRWLSNDIADTGPMLRLGDKVLGKATRFGPTSERPWYSSTISPAQLKEHMVAYYSARYAKCTRQKRWTWQSLRAINKVLEQYNF